MKTGFVIVILFVSTLFTQVLYTNQTGKSVMADTSFVNPNGSSELSLLMREMQAYTNNAKKALQNNTNPAPYPESFNKIYSATISDGMSKSDFYKQFADIYLTAVKNYSKSNNQERAENYNNMVNACLACHSQHCPGPVPVIKKMVWDPE